MTETSNELLITLGDGADPEEFKFPCGANSRDVELSNSFDEQTILDCDDPLTAAPFIVRQLLSQDTTATISGVLAKGAVWDAWRKWADDGVHKNIQIEVNKIAGSSAMGGHWRTSAVIESFKLQSEGTATVNITATIKGSGKRVWVPA